MLGQHLCWAVSGIELPSQGKVNLFFDAAGKGRIRTTVKQIKILQELKVTDIIFSMVASSQSYNPSCAHEITCVQHYL